MKTLVSFIVVLGILIFVHELGHFLFAKLFRVKVLKFSLGFGPKLLSRTVGETEYLISAFPLGGYVKMLGENPDEAADLEDPGRSFAARPVWNRFFIVLAGPLFNLLFSVFLFFMIFWVMGIPENRDSTTIGEVSDGSPALQAGIAPGDTITAIDGKQIRSWMDVLTAVSTSGGKTLAFTVLRDAEEVVIEVTPRLDSVTNVFGEEVEQRFMIGIVKKEIIEYDRAGPIKALQAGIWQTWMFIYLTFMGIVKILQNVVPASELGGPILIAQLAGEQARAGWLNLAHFMGLLSVNLGILNLLPIPVLDGGHLVFLTLEAIRRKPLAERAQILAQQVGIALLGTLMLFVFYNDIVRIFSQ
ncbi:MAG: RIP metalloprotease RseP [Desulfofustis sp.]|jgi:regulator of sigma E protease|nr:RIP metalloprotease RseP [Desulfofustis sp.]